MSPSSRSEGHGIPAALDVTHPVGLVRTWLLWWWPSGSEERLPAPEELRLRDGTQVWIRPILPSDRELHLAAFDQLSSEARYRRFLSPMEQLSESMLSQLVDDVDGVDHVAYYVFADDPDPKVAVLPICVARIKRDPERPDTADVAVTVMDPWHGRGVATAILQVLVDRRPEGVDRIVTAVFADNPASLAMLLRIGPNRVDPLGHGVLEVRVDLPPRHAAGERPEGPAAGAAGAQSGPGGTTRTLTVVAGLLGRTAKAPWRIALRTRDAALPWLRPGGDQPPAGSPSPATSSSVAATSSAAASAAAPPVAQS